MVRGGETVVRLNVRGERFDTVMAAIGSHVSRPVKLEVHALCLPLAYMHTYQPLAASE